MWTPETPALSPKAGMDEASPEKLLRDARVLLHDAEELIKATAGDIGERTREARAKLAGALVVTRETCNRLEDRLSRRALAANVIVRQRPYEMIGIAFGIGMILGILLDRVCERPLARG
ncbi:MAG: DUF883 family protein [Verrucomicrobiales bacterium]|nr:DUF883 family protein [Verrucomicrobiales bacterium]